MFIIITGYIQLIESKNKNLHFLNGMTLKLFFFMKFYAFRKFIMNIRH